MNEIVILGSLGAVGSRVAELLADQRVRLAVAARRAEAVEAQARRLGARAVTVDLDDPTSVREAVRGARVAVLGLEHVGAARAVLEAGVSFVDVGATPAHLTALCGLDPLARRRSATGAVSVGIAPGASNLLAHAAAATVGGAAEIAITVMLGGAERHGPAAVRWTVDSLLDWPRPSAVGVHVPGLDGRTRRRTAMEFPFADAPVVATATGARVTTRLTLDSPLATTALRSLALLRPLRGSMRVRRALARTLSSVHLGGEDFTVRADAWGSAGHAAHAVTGRGQTAATAAVAARVARSLLSGNVPRGVVHLPELPVARHLVAELEAAGTWRHLTLGPTLDAGGGLSIPG